MKIGFVSLRQRLRRLNVKLRSCLLKNNNIRETHSLRFKISGDSKETFVGASLRKMASAPTLIDASTPTAPQS